MTQNDPVDLLVVGSVAYDTVETPTAVAERILGGSGSFFSVSSAHFCDPGVVAVVGDDFAAEHEALLRDTGVDLAGLQHEAGPTFFWRGRYSENMISRESLATELGVFADFRPQVPERYTQVPFLFLANIAPELQLRVLDQVQQPAFIGLDTMDFWINGDFENLKKVMARVNAVFINDEEAELCTGERNVTKAARILHEMGPEVVVIKRGEHGALMFTKDDVFYAPAFPLDEVKDPTGAGDTFAGGFMGYVAAMNNLNNETLRRAMLVGTVMASFAVQDFSLDGLIRANKEQIEARYQALRNLTATDDLSL